MRHWSKTRFDIHQISSSSSIWSEPSINESSVQWGNGIFGSQGTEVIATDSNGLEEKLLDDSKSFSLGLYSDNWTIGVSKAEMNVTPLNYSLKTNQTRLN